MCLWVNRLLTRPGRWLIRKIRQVQHNMSHCGVLSWRGIQTKKRACKLVSFWIQFNIRTQVFHRREGTQDGHITCLKHINLRRTWWCCWKVNNATLLAGFCLRVGEHERLITIAEFRRNAIIPCMLLESFDCGSRSNRPCAAQVHNNVCWMIGKVHWSCHDPCSMSFCAEPPSIWSPFFLCRCAVRGGLGSRRDQRCKVFVINGLITSLFERFLS